MRRLSLVIAGFWMLACSGAGEVAPRAEAARGRAIEGEIVRYIEGDLLHVVVRTANGKEYDLVCMDTSCSVPGMAPGVHVEVSFERREVGELELEVVTSMGFAAGGE